MSCKVATIISQAWMTAAAAAAHYNSFQSRLVDERKKCAVVLLFTCFFVIMRSHRKYLA